MRLRHLFGPLAMVALLGAGCSDGDAPDEITPLPDDIADIPTDVTVTIQLVDFGTELVQLSNTSEQSGATGALRICQNAFCHEPPIDSLEFGAIAIVDAADVGDLDPDGGELALFSEVDGGSQLVSYVAWGDGEHDNLQLAIDEDMWDAEETIEGGAVFLQSRSPVPNKASDWTATS